MWGARGRGRRRAGCKHWGCYGGGSPRRFWAKSKAIRKAKCVCLSVCACVYFIADLEWPCYHRGCGSEGKETILRSSCVLTAVSRSDKRGQKINSGKIQACSILGAQGLSRVWVTSRKDVIVNQILIQQLGSGCVPPNIYAGQQLDHFLIFGFSSLCISTLLVWKTGWIQWNHAGCFEAEIAMGRTILTGPCSQWLHSLSLNPAP